jgi:carboxyl-terminal processing protease
MIAEQKPRRVCGLLIVLCFTFFVVSATYVYGDLTSKRDEAYEGLKLFSDVITEIEKNYVEPVDTKELIQKAIEGMVQSLDPHSAFLPPEAYSDLQIETKGEFGGIGIVISKRNDFLAVVAPIEGTPAFKAGILAQDIITRIDGESTRDMKLWEAVKKMRGKPDTTVEITIYREETKTSIDFSLVRGIIPLDSVRSLTLRPGYGYLWITNFRENTTEEVRKALKKLEDENDPLRGLILDLRDNPGGLLDQAIKVADIFLDSGSIVTIRGRDDARLEAYEAQSKNTVKKYPIVLLINGGSASASEIVAGALQDNQRALVVGTTSFGKGSVQTVRQLRDDFALKYTIARYYTPKGRSIQAEGIVPDLVVKRRLVDEGAGDGLDAILPKEENLKNHLLPFKDDQAPEVMDESEKMDGKDGKDADENASEIEEIIRLRDALYDPGEKASDTLLRDSQINRAYEILRGYVIFRALTSDN